MIPNRESVDARLCQTFDEAVEHGPGAFVWMETTLPDRFTLAFIPPGETEPRGIAVALGPALGGGIWGWDGNVESPTIVPSINCLTGCLWHGFLTAGRFVSC